MVLPIQMEEPTPPRRFFHPFSQPRPSQFQAIPEGGPSSGTPDPTPAQATPSSAVSAAASPTIRSAARRASASTCSSSRGDSCSSASQWLR